MLKKSIYAISTFLTLAFGVICFYRLLYPIPTKDNNIIGPIVIFILGSSSLMIGFKMLTKMISYTNDKPAIATAINKEPNQESAEDNEPDVLSFVFMLLGHITLTASILGGIFIAFFTSAGSASGVAIGIGIFVATIFYFFGHIAKKV